MIIQMSSDLALIISFPEFLLKSFLKIFQLSLHKVVNVAESELQVKECMQDSKN